MVFSIGCVGGVERRRDAVQVGVLRTVPPVGVGGFASRLVPTERR